MLACGNLNLAYGSSLVVICKDVETVAIGGTCNNQNFAIIAEGKSAPQEVPL